MTKANVIFIRFLKGFVGSAIPTIVTALSGVTQFNTASEVKAFALTLAVPLITGLLLAAEKAINWQEPEKPVEIPQASEIKAAKKSRAKKQS